MSASLQWAEPVAAREWRWQTQELPAVKKTFWMVPKWSLLLGVPALLLVHHFAPMELPRIAICLICLAVLLPAHLYLSTWIICRNSKRYSITGKGLRLAYTSKFIYPWAGVENYSIVRHPRLPDLRVLEFKMKRYNKVHQWAFSTSQLDDREVEKAMQEHLPNRLLT